jgi:uncharacterized protein (DUF305 family)
METTSHSNHYGRLLIMTVLSFISMYVLMYAMVDRAANALPNLNQVYMAALMTAPMVIIEVLLMSAMYHNKRWNAAILALATVTGIAMFAFIRQQAAIGDRQFLRSMIPHHAGAILMCGQAPVQDPGIVALCRNIIASQQTEIDQMKAILAR